MLMINDSGHIEMVQVLVHISHSYHGDFHISLCYGSNSASIFSPNSTDARNDVFIDKMDVTNGFQGSDAKGS